MGLSASDFERLTVSQQMDYMDFLLSTKNMEELLKIALPLRSSWKKITEEKHQQRKEALVSVEAEMGSSFTPVLFRRYASTLKSLNFSKSGITMLHCYNTSFLETSGHPTLAAVSDLVQAKKACHDYQNFLELFDRTEEGFIELYNHVCLGQQLKLVPEAPVVIQPTDQSIITHIQESEKRAYQYMRKFEGPNKK